MKEKTFKHFWNLSLAVKIGLVLVIMNLCPPSKVCSKTIVPLSFLGRTTGRVNNHMMDKIMNLYLKGKKSCIEPWSMIAPNLSIFEVPIIL